MPGDMRTADPVGEKRRGESFHREPDSVCPLVSDNVKHLRDTEGETIRFERIMDPPLNKGFNEDIHIGMFGAFERDEARGCGVWSDSPEGIHLSECAFPECMRCFESESIFYNTVR